MFSNPKAAEGCLRFTEQAIKDMITEKIKLVVMSVRSAGQIAFDSDVEILKQFIDVGIRVLVIRDVPLATSPIPDCVQANPNHLSMCDEPRATRLLPDPLYNAALSMNNSLISTVDFTNAFCDANTCYGVVGGVIVYFDEQHMTKTFARSLQPYLEDNVVKAMS